MILRIQWHTELSHINRRLAQRISPDEFVELQTQKLEVAQRLNLPIEIRAANHAIQFYIQHMLRE